MIARRWVKIKVGEYLRFYGLNMVGATHYERLFQRIYPASQFSGLSVVPTLPQLLLSLNRPFNHVAESARRKVAVQNCQSPDVDLRFVLAVHGMEMRRPVFPLK